MRCSQPMGLAPAAEEYLQEHGIRVSYCPHCHRDNGYSKEETGCAYGMFGEIPLLRYHLKQESDAIGVLPLNAEYAEEFVQVCIWSSGPMEWLGLRLSDGTEIKWTEEELARDPEYSPQ